METKNERGLNQDPNQDPLVLSHEPDDVFAILCIRARKMLDCQKTEQKLLLFHPKLVACASPSFQEHSSYR